MHKSAGSAGHIEIPPDYDDTVLLEGKWVKTVLGIIHMSFQRFHQTCKFISRLKVENMRAAHCTNVDRSVFSKNPERYLYCIAK